MIKKIIFFSSLLIVYSCQNKQLTNKTEAIADSVASVSYPENEDSIPKTVRIDENQLKLRDQIQYIESGILFPNAAYRVDPKDEIEQLLNKSEWLEIYKDQEGYKIAKAEYTITNEEEEPCAGYPTQSIDTKRNTLLFVDIPNIEVGILDSIAFNRGILDPNNKIVFNLNNQKYTVEAKGMRFYKDDFRNIPNAYYQLTLQTSEETVLLLYQMGYNDTATEILFIGDLDKDNKPDFILASPRDYEEDRVIIILSKDNKQYEGTRQFDC